MKESKENARNKKHSKSAIFKKINTLTEMKNTFSGLFSRHGTAEESELEDVPI